MIERLVQRRRLDAEDAKRGGECRGYVERRKRQCPPLPSFDPSGPTMTDKCSGPVGDGAKRPVSVEASPGSASRA
jgi:hypothetical protein